MAKVSKRLRFEILRRDNHTCRYCGAKPPAVVLRVDHVVPDVLGGQPEPDNLVAACEPCNSGKTSIAPDASTVAQVSDDALRWARARSHAAQQLLDDLATRQAVHDQFEQAWNSWTTGRAQFERTMPLPLEWKNSIDNFIAAGLPMPILLDCIDRAMRSRSVHADNLFRYMCGIAWSRVTDLQAAAAAVVEDGAEPDRWKSMSRDDLEELCWRFEHVTELVLGRVPMWIHEEAERRCDYDYHCGDEVRPDRLHSLPDVLRHIGKVLSECNIQIAEEG